MFYVAVKGFYKISVSVSGFLYLEYYILLIPSNEKA
jgi:hypothetical protein